MSSPPSLSGTSPNATLVVVTSTTYFPSSSSAASSTRFRVLAVLLLLSLYGLRRYLHHRSIARTLHSIQRTKAQQHAAQVAALTAEDPRDLSLLSPTERDVLSHTATTLLTALRSGRLAARDVALTLIRQTLRLHRRVNLLSEPCFAAALQRSKELDAEYGRAAAEGRSVGPLHGLPISLKDSVGVVGLDCTLGVARYAGQQWGEDSLVVQLLRRAGAVIYTKTNVPQTLISFECSNPLFGVTRHLQSAAFTAGGSSGGEAALIAGGGSVLGIGTDIGGSVRIPAHFSGTYALKPTSRRVSLQGFRPSVPGQEAVPGVAGPMAMRVDDLTLLLQQLLVPDAWASDPDLVPLPLDVSATHATGPLRVGYYVDDGFVPPSPACARAVEETVAALRAAGHECVEWAPPRVVDAVSLYYALLSADGGRTMTDQLRGERREAYVTAMQSAINLPRPLKALIATLIRRLLRDPVAAQVFAAARPCGVNALWKLHAARKAYKADFFSRWHAQGLDVVVCPAHVLPATRHGEYKKISFTACYTLLYNLLDAPAGVCPVTVVKESDGWGLGGTGGEKARNLLEKAARACYNVKDSVGFPIGVQVVGAPYRDELVLRAMKEVERLLPWNRPQQDA